MVIVVCYIKNLRLKLKCGTLYNKNKNRWSKIGRVVMGVYSGWDSFLLKYGDEVFLERRSIFCMINLYDQY